MLVLSLFHLISLPAMSWGKSGYAVGATAGALLAVSAPGGNGRGFPGGFGRPVSGNFPIGSNAQNGNPPGGVAPVFRMAASDALEPATSRPAGTLRMATVPAASVPGSEWGLWRGGQWQLLCRWQRSGCQ